MSKAFVGQNSGGAAVEIMGSDSIFSGRAFRSPNHFRTYKESVPAAGTLSFGSDLNFQPTRNLDRAGLPTLKLEHGAASGTSTSGDYPRFCDWVGFFVLKECQIDFATSTLQKFDGFSLYRAHSHRARSEDSLAALVDGGLAADTAQRAANAQSASHVIYCPLILAFWCDQPKNWLPYLPNAIASPLEIRCTLASLNEIIETNGTATVCALSRARLRLEGVYLTNKENVKVISETLARDAQFDTAGWTRLVKTQERLDNQTVASGTSAQQISIQSLQKPYSDITFSVRDTTDIPSASSESANINYLDFQKVASYKIRAANEDLVPEVDDKYGRHLRQNQHSRGAVDEFIYRHSFSFAPDSSEQMGFMSFDGIGTPEYEFTMDQSQSSGRADFLGNTHNIVTLSNSVLSMLFR